MTEFTGDPDYDKLLSRILKGAEYLSRPDLSDEEREKGMKLYDALCDEVEKYRER